MTNEQVDKVKSMVVNKTIDYMKKKMPIGSVDAAMKHQLDELFMGGFRWGEIHTQERIREEIEKMEIHD